MEFAPHKVRAIRLPLTRKPTALDKRFRKYAEAQHPFSTDQEYGTTAEIAEWSLKALRTAIVTMVSERAREGSLRAARSHGDAFEWARISMADRADKMRRAAVEALTQARGAEPVRPRDDLVSVPWNGPNLIFRVGAVPGAMSVPAARELVGQPFLYDHKLMSALEQRAGPVHLVVVHGGVTETQAAKQLVSEALVSSIGMPAFEDLLERWDGETAVIRRDRETGGWIFVCVHSTRRGPAGGGTRMKSYGSPAEGLEDAMRLSAAMSRKLAVAGLPFGGGKGVIAVPEIPQGQQRRALMHRYGDLVASLGGTYRTSSDMNTDESDMDVIWERTKYVFGRSVAAGGSGSPARPTALGVFHGIRASLAHATGSSDLTERRILIQGAGGVGAQLAGHLAQAGASVLLADLDQGRAEAVAHGLKGEVVDPDRIAQTDADVYAPCAVGGVLSVYTASQLRCAVVAGSANNQLAQPEAAEVLRERGILYAPDYVINAGGAIGVTGLEQLGWSDAEVNAALERIGDTLREVFRLSEEHDISTAAAADAIANERIQTSAR